VNIVDLSLIQNAMLVILLGLAIVLSITLLLKLARNDKAARIEREYMEKLDSLRKQLEVTEKLLESKEKECREQLEKVARVNKMLLEIKKALDSGVVKLVCSTHGETVTVLVDGTIICPKGHRVWPPESLG